MHGSKIIVPKCEDHKPKMDYEEKARARAEAGGPKTLKAYHTKLAKDIK